MLRFFINPRLQDQAQSQKAIALERILWATIAAAMMVLVGVLLMPAFTRRWLLIDAFFLVLCLPLLVLNRSGRTRASVGRGGRQQRRGRLEAAH